MRLISLSLRNFKGQREFVLEPQGHDCLILGDNAVGKTTISDAYFYLLFDKDSANRKDFGIKTLGPDGQPIHYLEHEVSGVFEIADGERLDLRKTYKETWTQKRGFATKEFSGHTTDHKVNGVPVQKAEYDRWVAGICDEKRFRLLTDPAYFNTQLEWQERRKILLDVCGDISDEDVIKANPSLADLPGILGRHSLDDYRKILTSRRKEANEELKKIPVRIDELNRSMPDAGASKVDIVPLRDAVKKLTERRAAVSAGGEIAEKTVRLRNLEAAATDILTCLRSASGSAFEEAQSAVRRAEVELGTIANGAARLRSELQADREAAERLESELAERRKAYAAEEARPLEFTAPDVCAACGQSLPPERVAEVNAKALAGFNEAKAVKLAAWREEGLAKKGRLDGIRAKIETKTAELDVLDSKVGTLQANVDDLKAKTSALATPQIDVSDSPEYRENRHAQDALRLEISKMREGAESSIAELDAQLQEASTKVAEAETRNAKLEQRATSQKRVDELANQERELAAEVERIAREEHLADTFVRTKVSMLTERINSKFTIARFKLFEEQINGGLSEVCETLVGGVPYGAGLNHGARINAGLDIINCLAEHYGFAPPIFIDNSESVTRLMPTTGQQIRLIVSEPDKVLRVVINNPAQKEAISA